jgi:hypothetical protein
MDFEAILASILNPGEDGVSPTAYDDLSASYTEATSTRDAKISTSESRVAELELELLKAKSANWDLMQALPVADSEESDDNEEDTNSDEDSDSDDPDSDFFED